MTNQFMIKFAWKCNHEDYGEIVSFIVSPKVVTSSYGDYTTYGYNMGKDYDEVIRFPAENPRALSIVRKLAIVNSSQWAPPTFGDIIEEEFDLDDFFDEYYFQDNYGREVIFHTSNECF